MQLQDQFLVSPHHGGGGAKETGDDVEEVIITRDFDKPQDPVMVVVNLDISSNNVLNPLVVTTIKDLVKVSGVNQHLHKDQSIPTGAQNLGSRGARRTRVGGVSW